MLGEKAAAVKAYRKSLCPNPKNKGAETIIEKNKYESSTRYRIIWFPCHAKVGVSYPFLNKPYKN